MGKYFLLVDLVAYEIKTKIIYIQIEWQCTYFAAVITAPNNS